MGIFALWVSHSYSSIVCVNGTDWSQNQVAFFEVDSTPFEHMMFFSGVVHKSSCYVLLDAPKYSLCVRSIHHLVVHCQVLNGTDDGVDHCRA